MLLPTATKQGSGDEAVALIEASDVIVAK